MTLTRKLLKVFGISGAEANFGRFGSRAGGSPIETKDIDSIQALNAYLNGLQASLLPGQTRPFLEDMNSLFYLLSYQIAYVLQDGLPEWNVDTEYRSGSIVRKAGTFEQYGSVLDANVGHALPSKANNTWWQWLNPPTTPAGLCFPYMGAVAPFGYLMIAGQTDLSRAVYADLFGVAGETFGAGDGLTTFGIPDARGRTIIGAGAGGGLTLRALGAQLGAEMHGHNIDAHHHRTPILLRADGTTMTIGVDLYGHEGDGHNLAEAGLANTGVSPAGTTIMKTSDVPLVANPAPGNTMQPSLALNWIVKY